MCFLIFLWMFYILKIDKNILDITCDLFVFLVNFYYVLIWYLVKLILTFDVQSCDMFVSNMGLFLTVCECNLLISCVASYVDIICENKVPNMSKTHHDSWLECILIILILLNVIKPLENFHDVRIIGHILVLMLW
jgi:hypothetical protein